jgi:hypothetical protein
MLNKMYSTLPIIIPITKRRRIGREKTTNAKEKEIK